MSYRFHPGAEAEHFEATAFFESRKIGLGAAYLAEFEAVMTHVVKMPNNYRINRKPNTKLASLKQFPFSIIFRETGEVAQIPLFRISVAALDIGWIAFS